MMTQWMMQVDARASERDAWKKSGSGKYDIGEHHLGYFHRLYKMVPPLTELKTVGNGPSVKAGVHMKAVFWLGIMVLMQISRLRFNQSRISMRIPHIYVLGRFVRFFFW